MGKIIFNIDGIKNEAESRDLEKALKKIDGINKISIKPQDNQIEVFYNMESSSVDEIEQCIERTGHKITNENIAQKKYT